MLLQSMILIFLGVQASIKDDVAGAFRLLRNITSLALLSQYKVGSVSSLTADSDTILKMYGDTFSCVFLEKSGELALASSQCRFHKELATKSQAARETKKAVIGFAGKGWKSHFFSGEVALLSIPLFDSAGEVYGSISAERSLLQVYSQFQKEVTIAFCYLLVNVIIFVPIGFLRLSRIIFRPLDKLVLIAENYRPDEQSLITFSEDESPFRKLSISLNELLDRIRRDNQQLRKTVSDLEMANSELTERNELVIRSEKLASTGRLSAGLAHEIGNPLSIIQGYVELLEREDISEDERKKFSRNAQKELDRIKTLIRQLLDFSRPLQATKETVAVNDLILEVLSFISVEKSFAGCRIRTNLLAERDNLMVDKDALCQIFVNILFNAVDATAGKNEEREICIASYNELRDRDSFLGISVQDNGVGIAEDNLAHVFDPFFTTKEVGRGTGLGLFVCHMIIDKMGGHIKISNRSTKGVEVKIMLPIIEENQQRN